MNNTDWCINQLNKARMNIKEVEGKPTFDGEVTIHLNVVGRTIAELEQLSQELDEIKEAIAGPSLYPSVTGVSVLDDVKDLIRNNKILQAKVKVRERKP